MSYQSSLLQFDLSFLLKQYIFYKVAITLFTSFLIMNLLYHHTLILSRDFLNKIKTTRVFFCTLVVIYCYFSLLTLFHSLIVCLTPQNPRLGLLLQYPFCFLQDSELTSHFWLSTALWILPAPLNLSLKTRWYYPSDEYAPSACFYLL